MAQIIAAQFKSGTLSDQLGRVLSRIEAAMPETGYGEPCGITIPQSRSEPPQVFANHGGSTCIGSASDTIRQMLSLC